MMKHLLAIIAAMSLFSLNLFASPIEVGQPAPAMTVTIETGETLDLAEIYAKGPTLLFFYPRADTPGCTAQACNLRDNFSGLRGAGIQVLGVSLDSVNRQRDFSDRYQLPFHLISDEGSRLGSAFGVGSRMGVAYRRQSFLVLDGVVAWRDLSATPGSQSEDALNAFRALTDAN